MPWADYCEESENPDTPLKEMRGHFHKDVEIRDFDSAKRFYARIIKDYAEGAIPRDRARTLSYLLAGYLAYEKQETDEEFAAKIPEIERQLAEMRARR